MTAAEGGVSSYELVKHDADRIDVTRRRRLVALSCFWRQVLGSPDDSSEFGQRGAAEDSGNPKIAEAHCARPVEEHVFGFDVPVNNARSVHNGQSFEHFFDD
jgi:hypothetical protein